MVEEGMSDLGNIYACGTQVLHRVILSVKHFCICKLVISL